MKKNLIHVLATAAALTICGTASAAGGPSGYAVTFKPQGKIGEVVNNPYDIAPLTSVIKNGGWVLKSAHVRVVPKKGGQEVSYDVGPTALRTHGGIPVFGLYADHLNTVEVKYVRVNQGKDETIEEKYQIATPPVWFDPSWTDGKTYKTFDIEVKKKAPKAFADRLYLINNLLPASPKGMRAVWNNPMGGALQWNFYPQNAVVDTQGEVRWYMLPTKIYDPRDIYRAGIMMGFHQNDDGALSFGYGQRYAKYDMLGREIYNRRLPMGYADYSHAIDGAENGHTFLRVSSSDHRRPDGKRVHTVRDVIIEVDENGSVVDEFLLWDILDPYRDNLVKAMDQGAVCLNIDASKAGHTMTAEELAAQDASNDFGDITGVGTGRNWAHVNSVDYDPSDDSIIISSRHQSAIVKIGRDKKVKWILASPEGWKKGWAEKVLSPVDAKGNKIKCEGSKCEGDFDWTWTQHTAWRIASKSKGDIIYVSAFDNGDARGMEQPALAEEKYTRGVVYKIDQKKMTVEQVYEVGKKEGHDFYSPVTGLAKYMDDKDSFVVYYSTPGLYTGDPKSRMTPHIAEYKWGQTEPSVLIKLQDTMGYQAWPFFVEHAFNPQAK